MHSHSEMIVLFIYICVKIPFIPVLTFNIKYLYVTTLQHISYLFSCSIFAVWVAGNTGGTQPGSLQVLSSLSEAEPLS